MPAKCQVESVRVCVTIVLWVAYFTALFVGLFTLFLHAENGNVKKRHQMSRSRAVAPRRRLAMHCRLPQRQREAVEGQLSSGCKADDEQSKLNERFFNRIAAAGIPGAKTPHYVSPKRAGAVVSGKWNRG